eukprot:gene17414-20004_t
MDLSGESKWQTLL